MIKKVLNIFMIDQFFGKASLRSESAGKVSRPEDYGSYLGMNYTQDQKSGKLAKKSTDFRESLLWEIN